MRVFKYLYFLFIENRHSLYIILIIRMGDYYKLLKTSRLRNNNFKKIGLINHIHQFLLTKVKLLKFQQYQL